jgi:hypothetical protein
VRAIEDAVRESVLDPLGDDATLIVLVPADLDVPPEAEA